MQHSNFRFYRCVINKLSVNDTLAPIYNAYFVAQSDNLIWQLYIRLSTYVPFSLLAYNSIRYAYNDSVDPIQ